MAKFMQISDYEVVNLDRVSMVFKIKRRDVNKPYGIQFQGDVPDDCPATMNFDSEEQRDRTFAYFCALYADSDVLVASKATDE